MARSKSMASIDAELAKVTEEHAKAQARCDKLAARILELRKQKQEIEGNLFCYKHDDGKCQK
jgi:chromosome segregation ATPase